MSAARKLVCGRTNTCSHRSNFCALGAPFVGCPHKWRSLRLLRYAARITTFRAERPPNEAAFRKSEVSVPMVKHRYFFEQGRELPKYIVYPFFSCAAQERPATTQE